MVSKKEFASLDRAIEIADEKPEARTAVIKQIEVLIEKQNRHYVAQRDRLEAKLLQQTEIDPQLIASIETLQAQIQECNIETILGAGSSIESTLGSAKTFHELRAGLKPVDEVDRIAILDNNQKVEFKRLLRKGELAAESRWIEKSQAANHHTDISITEDLNPLLADYLGAGARVESQPSKVDLVSLDGKRKVVFDAFNRYVTTWGLGRDGKWTYACLEIDLEGKYVRIWRKLPPDEFFRHSHFQY